MTRFRKEATGDGVVRRVVCGKLEGDPADPEPGEGSQKSGRESEMGTDSSSPDTGAGTKHSWPTRRSAVQWDCASPGFWFAQWPHARQCWFQSSCTERRDQGCPEAPFSTHIRQLLIKAPSVSRAQEHRQARAVQQSRSPAAALP